MSPDLIPVAFLVAMIALACAILSALYVVCRHEPTPDKKATKRIVVSNVR